MISPRNKNLMSDNKNLNIENITNVLGDVVTGIPSPIRKNFFKVISQLCTAAVDIPVAKMESRASEIRAESEARKSIIQAEGEIISKSLNVPKEFIERASEKYASKIIKEQINLDDICSKTARNLENSQVNENTSKDIDDEWLNEFEDQARVKSSEEMKFVFSQILSQEIKSPGSISIKTVKLLSQLDKRTAILFEKLCSICISLRYKDDTIINCCAASLDGEIGSNSLMKYGLAYSALTLLQEYGLVGYQIESRFPFNPCIFEGGKTVGAGLYFGKKDYALIPLDKEKYDKELILSGIGLTQSGCELFRIIPFNPNLEYTKDLESFFQKKNLTMKNIKNNA